MASTWPGWNLGVSVGSPCPWLEMKGKGKINIYFFRATQNVLTGNKSSNMDLDVDFPFHFWVMIHFLMIQPSVKLFDWVANSQKSTACFCYTKGCP